MELLGFGGSQISLNPLSLSPRHTLLTFLSFEGACIYSLVTFSLSCKALGEIL